MCTVIVSIHRGCTNPERLNCARYHLRFVGPRCGTCLCSPSGTQHLEVGANFSENLCTPDPYITFKQAFSVNTARLILLSIDWSDMKIWWGLYYEVMDLHFWESSVYVSELLYLWAWHRAEHTTSSRNSNTNFVCCWAPLLNITAA